MGFRIRRSFKIAPGVRVNVGKRSSSISVGNKYGRTTISTGSSRKSRSSGRLKQDVAGMFQANVSEKKHKSDQKFLKVCGIIMYIVTAGFLLMAIACFSFSVFGGILCSIPTLICFAIARFLSGMSKN